jgi:NhaP-type Na+/H+ or K+/H+ antiporter
MVIFLFIIILIARFINIYLCSRLANLSRTDNLIEPKKQFFLWFSGVRGAMAFALAIKSKVDLPGAGPIFLVLTLIIISFTLVYSTLFLDSTIKSCDLIDVCNADNFEDSALIQKSCFISFKEKMKIISDKYLKPLVQRENLEDNQRENLNLQDIRPDGNQVDSNNKIEIKNGTSANSSSMNSKNYYEKREGDDITMDKKNFQIKNKHLFE